MPPIRSVRPNSRSKGWLVSVQTPERTEAYAAGAEEYDRAFALVAEHCKAALSETVKPERRLTDGEIARLDLKDGEVKPVT